jgi:hypothetical protein
MLQLDIKTEFSYEELDEDINMNQPEDFIKSIEEKMKSAALSKAFMDYNKLHVR